MFLGIYLGTTAFAWYSVFRFKKIMENRLKNDGYKFVRKKHDLMDIPIRIAFIVLISIPLANLMFPFALTTKDEDYDAFRNKLLEDGSIIDPEDEEYEYERPIVNQVTHNNFIEKDNLSVEKDPTQIAYIHNMRNTHELVKMVEAGAKKRTNKVIEVDDSKLVLRKNRDGHVYYSSINIDDSKEEVSGHTLKKSLFKK